jgi:hypothetical protein
VFTCLTTYHTWAQVQVHLVQLRRTTNYGVIVAGQDEAVASAEQINKVENYRDPDSFADIVRGMHLYGRKILRPEALDHSELQRCLILDKL